MHDVVKLLEIHNPSFQLKSGGPELRSSESLFAERGATDTRHLPRASAALPLRSLRALHALLSPEHTTLETGGGQSTVVFAAKVKRHYCVNPDRTANELIVDFLTEHGLRTDHVTFVDATSDVALPSLDIADQIDVALLDGSHSFPIPMIDWHYVNRYLRAGGKMVVDNVEINAVRILTEFLDMEPSYRLMSRVSRSPLYNCFIYEKVNDEASLGWGDQGINNAILWRLCTHSALTQLLRPVQRLRKRLGRLTKGGERR